MTLATAIAGQCSLDGGRLIEGARRVIAGASGRAGRPERQPRRRCIGASSDRPPGGPRTAPRDAWEPDAGRAHGSPAPASGPGVCASAEETSATAISAAANKRTDMCPCPSPVAGMTLHKTKTPGHGGARARDPHCADRQGNASPPQSSDLWNLRTLIPRNTTPSTASAAICGHSTSRPTPFRNVPRMTTR